MYRIKYLLMMSSESLISLDFGSESTNSSINCDYCHSKIENNSDHVEISFKSIKAIQNNNDSSNNQNIYLNLHKKCYKYSFDNLNSLIDSNRNNTKYCKKYCNNIKNNWPHVLVSLIFLILIICVILYDCYAIIITENYLSTQTNYYNDCSSYFTEWLYRVHVLIICNVLIQCILCFAMCIKLILLIFY